MIRPAYQIPRYSLLWLFVAQLAVLLPHILRTPVWVSVMLLAAMGWRLQVFRGRWNFPSKQVKWALLFFSCVGLLLSFPSFFGLEALVSALLVGYALKLLEMYHKRDALVVLYLSLFLVMTSFLFEQAIWLAAYNVLAIILVVTALSGLYQEEGHRFPRRSVQKSAVMVLQAIPLMILMFIVLPRLPSLWSIPLQKNTPKSGMSDSMSPGDLGRLALSNEPVMRITFKDAEPAPQDLYWRGLVFSRFDGRRWVVSEVPWKRKKDDVLPYYRLDQNRRAFLENIKAYGLVVPDDPAAKRWVYEVIIEATQTPWLYALSYSIPDTEDLYVNHEQLLAKNGLLSQRFKYDVRSYGGQPTLIPLAEWQRQANLALPDNSNPRARELAKQWRAESISEAAYVQRLLDWYQREFFYTLKPPMLGKDSVDEFLFQTKKGFCEHFASSFVFMARAAGIPARVVAGYQGGEKNPLENYYLVRQYDAHAWAEIWVGEETGYWQRVDPTFAVAPQRILDGFRSTFEQRGELDLPLTSLENYRELSWLNRLRLQLDLLNYQWARWVLGYDAEKQFALLSGWLGEYSLWRVAAAALLLVFAFFALLYLWLWWQERDRHPDPVQRAWRQFIARMARRGLALRPGEAPQVYLQRLADENPGHYSQLPELGQQLYVYWYQADDRSAVRARRLCKMLAAY